jgi:hypothetical protein
MSDSPGQMTFDSDGSYHGKFAFGSADGPSQLALDGTWEVRDGYLILTTTNSVAQNAPVKVAIGHVARDKIIFMDAHKLVYTNGTQTFTQVR